MNNPNGQDSSGLLDSVDDWVYIVGGLIGTPTTQNFHFSRLAGFGIAVVCVTVAACTTMKRNKQAAYYASLHEEEEPF